MDENFIETRKALAESKSFIERCKAGEDITLDLLAAFSEKVDVIRELEYHAQVDPLKVRVAALKEKIELVHGGSKKGD